MTVISGTGVTVISGTGLTVISGTGVTVISGTGGDCHLRHKKSITALYVKLEKINKNFQKNIYIFYDSYKSTTLHIYKDTQKKCFVNKTPNFSVISKLSTITIAA